MQPQVVSDVPPLATPRAQLDARQYTRDRILRYERAYGPGFVSTGGLDTTRELVGMLQLQPDQRVLDLGCGVGGGAMYMARECGVYVHAIDLSMNMVLCALERANTLLDSNVSFEIADVSSKEMEAHTFDVVFSKDVMQHIHDKATLLAKCVLCKCPQLCCVFDVHANTHHHLVVLQAAHLAATRWHPAHCRPLPRPPALCQPHRPHPAARL